MKKTIKTTLLWAVFVILLLCVSFFVLRYLYPKDYSDTVQKYAKQYGIEPELVFAIIKCESNFDKYAHSHADALGLMQITKETYEWAAKREKDTDYASNSLYEPETNVRYGCVIFSILQGEFKDDATALAAYNAGRGRVKNWLSDESISSDGKTLDTIPFSETANYVKKVLRTQKIYNLIY